MGFIVYEAKRKLADIVKQAYGELGEADAERAEAAILKANPHLARIKDAVPGSLIVVPAVPGIRPAKGERIEQPAAAAVSAVVAALDAYRQRFQKAVESEHARLTEVEQLLKSRPLRTQLRDIPEAAPFLERATVATAARLAEVQDARELARDLQKAQSDLAKLAESLR